MKIEEIFGKAVNIASKNGIEKSLVFLQLPKETIENFVKKKKFLVSQKNFDIVIDYKPKINQINLYLVSIKWSKKLLLSLNKSTDFKSMMVLLGKLQMMGKNFELRLGAFGISSSVLTKAIIKLKMK